ATPARASFDLKTFPKEVVSIRQALYGLRHFGMQQGNYNKMSFSGDCPKFGSGGYSRACHGL
ncbi:hypothetical protein SDB63_09185, partial [Brucella sp. NBRC 113783]|uniref:hypothetical protein n=1 Tax=Brucella sp. NBRC 113783 TaxID=3075478 RepID=UPI0029C03FAD